MTELTLSADLFNTHALEKGVGGKDAGVSASCNMLYCSKNDSETSVS